MESFFNPRVEVIIDMVKSQIVQLQRLGKHVDVRKARLIVQRTDTL
jgi:hypothetical protein